MKPIKEIEINSNNSWGFGGSIYTRKVYKNNIVVEKGRAYFRHMPSEAFERAFVLVGEELVKIVGVVKMIKEIIKSPDHDFTLFRAPETSSCWPFVCAENREQASQIARKSYHDVAPEEWIEFNPNKKES